MIFFCDGFNTDTIKDSKKTDFDKLLTAYDFQRKNSEPTRVTPTSATCLDHILTRYQTNTETNKTRISDHYTVLRALLGVIVKKPMNSETIQNHRDMCKINGQNALVFWFF